mmetsp:Transcript_34094/g.100196  ORF Transcript_34094/g.100196 Transcript_34094/m.100196 type:complete len:158 (+) Transcript_34094:62-535(+)
MLIVTLGLVGYALIGLLGGNPAFTLLCFCIFAVIELGLQEIAAAMSDPFGDDDIDFDTEGLLSSAYNNAISYLIDDAAAHGSQLPTGLYNPLTVVGPPVRWGRPHQGNASAGSRGQVSFFKRMASGSTTHLGGASGTWSERRTSLMALRERGEEFDA